MGSACSRRPDVQEGLAAIPNPNKRKQGTIKVEIPVISPEQNYILNNFPSQVKDDLEELGKVGFEDVGQTSHILALLQCFSNTQPLVDYFISNHYEQDLKQEGFTRAFGELVAAYWMDNFQSILPRMVVYHMQEAGCISNKSLYFSLSYLLNTISKETNRDQQLEGSELIGNNDELLSAKAWHYSLQKNSSIIIDLFQGQYRIKIKCKECNYVEQGFQTFQFLELHLPNQNNCSIDQCFINDQQNVDLKQDHFCAQCKKQGIGLYQKKIYKLPPILIILVKRFMNEEQQLGWITTNLQYLQQNWDMQVHQEGPHKFQPLYNLYASIGKNRDYFAIVQHHQNGLWYRIQNDIVTQLTTGIVLDSQTHALFYYRKTQDKFYRQVVYEQENWPQVLSMDGFSNGNLFNRRKK